MKTRGSRIFSVEEAKKILDVSHQYLYGHINDGDIEPVIMRDPVANHRKQYISESDLNKLSIIRHRRKWTDFEDKTLRDVIDGEMTIKAAADRLNRTIGACKMRIRYIKAHDKRKRRPKGSE